MTPTFLGGPKRIALRGVAALAFGVATLLWPDVTLWALVVLWGAYAFVDGVIALSASIADPLLPHRGWDAFSGLSGIGAGVVTFLWPGITALALLYVIAVWALVIGVSTIAFAISERKEQSGMWLMGLAGVLAVVLSVMLVITPGSGALAITWAIGWWACLYGTVLLGLAWTLHHDTSTASRPSRIGTQPVGHTAG